MDGISNNFPAQNATVLQEFAYTISIFSGSNRPGVWTHTPNFSLASLAFPNFLSYETTADRTSAPLAKFRSGSRF